MKSKEITSPCVRNCCLDRQDMCVGCYRMLDEIVGWGDASTERRAEILNRCSLRAEKSDLEKNKPLNLTR